MLKKQTVWLLTMLSLMIVLSVYYMSSPNGDELAFVNDQSVDGEQLPTSEMSSDVEVTEAEGTSDAEGEAVSSSTFSSDELFATIRMEMEDERSKRLDQLDDIVASSSASTDDINKAYDEMKEIESVSTKESILEENIKAENGFPDVLVRNTGGDVVVTVKADELSQTVANNIMQMVSDEFGRVQVEVKYQPVSK
ncbi:SpoIIIAH-like family protein [Aquibacillus salsiterrae]|uniref:SpoIIIAH-like family protein n=1 Tax=Aquibacillus salsiterrae TaxID=2950439 RepID=A0A9X3WAE8_9BACI|nr:SpoIIIAH-like family protein [Aquibacillus salsiterrae]MDC3415487.1 SpoIIIAH-like family protein [Aquibacillus salsiterrae]